MKRWMCWGLMCVLCFVVACAGVDKPKTTGAGQPKTNKFVLLSSTIGPIDAGIVGALETEFEKETGDSCPACGRGNRGGP